MKKLIFSLMIFISVFANAATEILDSQILQLVIYEARSITVYDEGTIAPSNKQLPARFANALRNSDLSREKELAESIDGVSFSCEERDSVGDDLIYGCTLIFLPPMGADENDEGTVYFIEALVNPETMSISILSDAVYPEIGD